MPGVVALFCTEASGHLHREKLKSLPGPTRHPYFGPDQFRREPDSNIESPWRRSFLLFQRSDLLTHHRQLLLQGDDMFG
jgi:hypothetical protein